jgi:hypothetical protein
MIALRGNYTVPVEPIIKKGKKERKRRGGKKKEKGAKKKEEREKKEKTKINHSTVQRFEVRWQ